MLLTSKKEKDRIITFYNSTNIAKTEYMFVEEKLIFTFNGGRKYLFEKFPLMVFLKLQESESVGKYFNESIKNKFNFDRIEDETSENMLLITEEIIDLKKKLNIK